MIECQICQRQLGTLVGKHLKSHGLSSQEYQEKFPGHPVSAMKPWSEELRARHIQLRTGRTHSEETKKKIGAGNKGKVMPKEAVERQKESYQKFLENNGGSPQKGYKRSEEFKQRMRHIAKNRDPALVQQKVDQMLAARRGSKASQQQKENYSKGRLKYMADNPDKLPRQMFNTVPEREFEEHLKNLGIPYSKSFHLKNRVFDFKIYDDILIEIDGPYHRKLGFYLPINATDDEKVSKLLHFIERDRHKNRLAQENGFFLYRIPVNQHLPANWYEILISQGYFK